MKRALVAAVLLVVFVATLTASLPVGAAVRWALADAGIDPGTVSFDAARLRWNGIVLDRVAIDTGWGDPLALPWLRVRPSLVGLVLRGDGLPATGAAQLCDGWIDGQAEPAGTGRRVSGVWADLDLARCADAFGIPGEISGHLQGRIDLTLDRDGDRHGTGVVRLREVDWHAPGVPRHVPTRADVAELQWDVDGRTATIRRFEMSNDEFEATITGTVRLAAPLVESDLALALAITPRSSMPQAHRDFLASLPGSPPDRRGARRFRVDGTLGAPILERPS
jgi:type II secretion system protein N